jgi:hypothetical protein
VEKLNGLKAYKKMTCDKRLDALPEGDEEGMYTENFRSSLLRSLLDLKDNKTYTLEEVKKQLGIQ